MPYIYAIHDIGTHKDEVSGREETRRIYHPVDKTVAEPHEDGRWAVVTKDGSLRSQWFDFRPTAEASLKYAEPDATGKDSVGQVLHAGDLVMTTVDKYADLALCEVVSFTGQKVRVRPFTGAFRFNGYDTILKFPYMIVRIDKALVF